MTLVLFFWLTLSAFESMRKNLLHIGKFQMSFFKSLKSSFISLKFIEVFCAK